MSSSDGHRPSCRAPIGVPPASYVSVAIPRRRSASYAFSRPLRKRASRVARPTTSGSTPVAPGSSVPVCPTRRSPRTLRSRAATSCDVGPAGLSTTSNPSIDGLLDLLNEQLLQHGNGARGGASGGILVSAAVKFLRDRPDVDLARRPHADAILSAFDLLEEDHRLDFVDGQRQIDQAFSVIVRASGRPRHLVI